MFLIFHNRVILGVDGFIQGPYHMGSQLRIFCFGLNFAIMWGDKDPDGNGYEFYHGLPSINEVF